MATESTRGMSIEQRHRHYCPPGNPDECWEWQGFFNEPGGYGVICVGNNGNGSKHRGAHVVAWELHNGSPVPPGYLVRHTCDNKPCCNWNHLILGTPLLNARDREERNPGTQARGSKAGPSKLTENQVVLIREWYRLGHTQRQLASDYGVNQSAISLIVNRKTWTHI